MSDTFHHYQDLITLFNTCFTLEYNTQLVKGEDEPLYLPANAQYPFHSIIFANGFFSSALHECAHWFIAGSARRQLIDYGYWYVPDGRNQEQQYHFQQVEVKPQALEWILSEASGYTFQFSLDNLNSQNWDMAPFKEAVYQQVLRYKKQGLPKRASLFYNALTHFYKDKKASCPS